MSTAKNKWLNEMVGKEIAAMNNERRRLKAKGKMEIVREVFNKKNIKSYGIFHNWSDPPSQFMGKKHFFDA